MVRVGAEIMVKVGNKGSRFGSVLVGRKPNTLRAGFYTTAAESTELQNSGQPTTFFRA